MGVFLVFFFFFFPEGCFTVLAFKSIFCILSHIGVYFEGILSIGKMDSESLAGCFA